MARYFKSVNKGSVQLDVFYGWDIDVKEWFIDVKMTGFSGGNLVQWFDSETSYKKTLKSFFNIMKLPEFCNMNHYNVSYNAF